MKRRITIKEAVRMSLMDFINEDKNSELANNFTRREREKRKKFEEDDKDEWEYENGYENFQNAIKNGDYYKEKHGKK